MYKLRPTGAFVPFGGARRPATSQLVAPQIKNVPLCVGPGTRYNEQ